MMVQIGSQSGRIMPHPHHIQILIPWDLERCKCFNLDEYLIIKRVLRVKNLTIIYRYKGLSGVGLSSSFKFGVLTKIVKHLKQKFQDGEDHPLALEELLDETNQLDVSGKIRQVQITKWRHLLEMLKLIILFF